MGKLGVSQMLRSSVVLALMLLASSTLALSGVGEHVGALFVYRLSVKDGRLVSEERVNCTSLPGEAGLVKESLCSTGVGRLVRGLLLIDLRAPPGISHGFDVELRDFASLSQCVRSCTNGGVGLLFDQKAINNSETGPPAVLGLHVGSPCCGEGYAVFVLDVSARKIAQYEVWSPSPPENFVFDCQVWQINQMPFGGAYMGLGLIFPVGLYLCDVPVSNIVSDIDDRILVGLLQAEISVTEAVEGIFFPREVLTGISGWIASKPNSETSLRDAGACSFQKQITTLTETPKEQLVCKVPNLLKGLLPVLKIVVKLCIDHTQTKFSESSLFVDLNQMVDREGHLRLNSSGSISAALKDSNNAVEMPKVVIGVLFIRDLVISFARNPSFSPPTAGLPLVEMHASNFNSDGFFPGMNASRKESIACVLPKQCGRGEYYFPSIDRCGAPPDCGSFLPYRYNTETLRCEINIKLALIIFALSSLFILTDVALLLMRRHMEKLLRTLAEEELAQKVK
ncbi:hypothetical protein TraAM80_07854 [Trypanosoma rangeli]|uniref:Uncharacterized protein n=1 Tax=Trypanosoma rangeli TaxID=5698 RepID=A0A3R7NBH5_TRYRA|nr:uncharacterized protein TraAM80_07854 [Trypanosoma rangeli]RNF00036.1 hypothetical protein TraAM80_07854 [Trypanosoma rangeli]|eukprot:RNF00036.1 hypothetical protein TraAM80_07854 [Trypanosoma rangeli]